MLLSGPLIQIESDKNNLKAKEVHEACSDDQKKTADHRTEGSIAVVPCAAAYVTLDIGLLAEIQARRRTLANTSFSITGFLLLPRSGVDGNFDHSALFSGRLAEVFYSIGVTIF